MLREIKYLFGLIVPVLIFISLYFNGIWSYFAVAFAFVLVPLLELILPYSTYNMSKEEELTAKKRKFYDWVLYIQLPLLYAALVYFLFIVSSQSLSIYEIIGKTFSMGMGCGVLGINIGHELGHRHKKHEQWMAQGFLLSSLYMHFFIEHNRGHHKNIATPLDPATSRRGESLYAFWFRSVTDGYLSAWKLENSRLRKKGERIFSLKNQMVVFQMIQITMVVFIFFFFGWIAGLAFLGAATVGFLLLETVNYIEHYGLLREEIQPGVYEKTKPHHSWNSNHPLGRILLYELTRHSDHHFHAGRKYQTLRHFDDAPQMPTGYPGMMVLSFLTPLWFRVMDKQLSKHRQQYSLLKAA